MGRLCYPTQHPGSPEYSGWYFSLETVTVQGGYGVLFAVMVQIFLSITRVAVQIVSEPENCHGAGFNLWADARVRVRWLAGFVWITVNCKNRDKQLTHIVRVISRPIFLEYVYALIFLFIRQAHLPGNLLKSGLIV